MRAFWVAATTVAGLAAFAGPGRAQVQKVAYLNSQRILAEAPGAEGVRDRIQQEMARYEAQVQVLRDSLNAMIADYQKKSVLLSPEEKRKQEEAIGARQQQAAQRAEAINQQAAQKQQELMAPIMTRIEQVIEGIRKEGGYAIIFDAAQPGIVSADTLLDVTASVIAKLKAAASGAASKRP